MRFAILGPLEVHNDTGPVHIESLLQRRLLAVLIARASRPVPPDVLEERLWGAAPPGDARKALSWHVLSLRKALGAKERIVYRNSGYVLDAEPDALDFRDFERLCGEAAPLVEPRPDSAVPKLRAALSLWRGRAYAGLADSGLLLDEANRLEELRLNALEQFATARLRREEHSGLIPELSGLVTDNPYRERLRELLMLALYRAGRQADALEVYQDGRVLAANDLGLNPGPSLRRLQQRILNNDPGLDAAGAQPPKPEAAVVPQQLPSGIGAFTGRESEVADLLAAAEDASGTVMVTAVDGMAGIGKTTLAVQVAHRLAARFPDGQLFIDLHGFSGEIAPVSPALALERMLRALGVPQQQIPEHVDERSALFRSVLSGRRVLLLLDNAATEQQVVPLLPGTGGNLALITGRRRFAGIDDAKLVALGLLDMEHGIDMFTRACGLSATDSARRDVIGEIVELCGRLPLAIRISAQQLRRRSSWTLDELCARLSYESQRLETLSARDRSVSAAFHSSYRDLDGEQQRTFRMLSVFPTPSFDAQAAAALADIPLATAQRQLDDMLDAHLLNSPSPGRYTFHDLMRQFASAVSLHAETDTGREAASFRLLDAYRTSAFAESARIVTGLRADPSRTDPSTDPPTGDLDTGGQISLEVAVGKAIELGIDAHVWHIGDVSHELAPDRGQPERRTLLARATDANRRATEPLDRAIALNNLATAHLLLNQYLEAIDHFERSLLAREELGDSRGQAAVLNSLGIVHNHLGDLERAADCFDRAMNSAYQAGADQTEALAITNYVVLADYLDMHEQALPLLNRARDIFQRDAHPRQQARLSFCFGVIYGGMGQTERAIKHLDRARSYCENNSEPFGLSHVLTALAANLRGLGRLNDAIDHHRRAIRAGTRVEDIGLKARNLVQYGATLAAAGDHAAAIDRFTRGAGLANEANCRYEQAQAEHGLADCHKALGDTRTSEKHLRESLRIYTAIGAPMARRLREHMNATTAL